MCITCFSLYRADYRVAAEATLGGVAPVLTTGRIPLAQGSLCAAYRTCRNTVVLTQHIKDNFTAAAVNVQKPEDIYMLREET